MSDILTEVRFLLQVVGDARRVVLCPPDLESRVKVWVDARGIGGLIEVRADSSCPPDRIFVIDEAALEAASRAAMQQIAVRVRTEEPVRFRPRLWWYL